ncbi:protein shisa-5-like isoform X2 [Branchiostoma floridae]|uniref:Protein shisa-5-like isoform X2 n=1 Tax=Branchiostoma floridae TaxID=7739 RepID=A0A9J7MDB2_BRAFL|nr:protein shisa-5-like isoform X2 [Branchiostoma floridae]
MAGVWTTIVLLTIVQWQWTLAGIFHTVPDGYEGCYTDNIFVRVFPHEEKWDFLLTNARCVTHCRNNGYAYAGTQFALQCFCGTEQNFQNLGAALSDSECNSDCSGNNAEKCGGSLKLSVYEVVDPASSGGLGIGAIIGIVVGVIILLTVMFIIICVVACQSKPSSRVTATGVSVGGNTVVNTTHMGGNTVVMGTNMMYPGNGVVVQQGGMYPMRIQQPAPYQQPMQPQQPPPYPPPQPQQPPGYPQPNQPQQQSSQIPPPPAYDEPAKPSDGQLYSQ